MIYTVYGKPNCPFCDKAKGLLTLKGHSVKYVDIVSQPEQRDIMFDRVRKATGSTPRTVPQIFVGDEYIGGYTDLESRLNSTF